MAVFAREMRRIENHSGLLNDPSAVAEIRKNILEGDIYIAKRVLPRAKLLQIRDYLTQVGKSSLPNYCPIEEGSPNFHRMNAADPRSYVQGCFHQFTFFPWNQDVFQLFTLTREIYQMRNMINNVGRDKFLGMKPEDGCAARLSFQFYPKGNGMLNKHVDPVDHHQLTVPTVAMSEKGADFKTGGVYVETKSGTRLNLEEHAEIGDVIYFNAQTPHGVETIDPEKEPDWVSFEGRWMCLIAVNKLAANNQVADAVDLGK